MRESESLLMATQYNVIKNNYVKAKIDNTQHISKCKLCGNWDETVYNIKTIETNLHKRITSLGTSG